MNFTSRGHLAMETQKHVTLAGGNISIFCYSLSLRAISIQVFFKKITKDQINGRTPRFNH